MWGGRFSKGNSTAMEQLSYSLHFDQKLYEHDIEGSLAHCEGLLDSGILTLEEKEKVHKGLLEVKEEIAQNRAEFNPLDEDIHMGIERLLTEKLGDLGKKLHTGRSRNDQVATDFRLYIRKWTEVIFTEITLLQKEILQKAKSYQGWVMPGYTHLQQAQPIAISHYLMSFFFALERDKQRFRNVYLNSEECPLGSGALAGSGFPYDREKVAQRLGFAQASNNSIDATSHRDIALEFSSAIGILSTLFSRYAEDWVTWSSLEFGFIQLSEELTTGSSIMPQKKNPDAMELIRGKTGRLLGAYTSLFTVIKAAPMCYSRDLQEDKEPVFDAVETITVCIKIMQEAVHGIEWNKDRISKAMDSFLLATDVADDLAKAGVPFRDAHHLVGNLVKKAEDKNLDLRELPDEDWQQLPNGLKIKSSLDYEKSLERRDLKGGTGPNSVKNQFIVAEELCKAPFKL